MDRTTVSSLYSLATLTAGFLLFAVGKLTGRFGHRVMMTWTAVLLGLACWWNSFVAGTLTLFIGFFYDPFVRTGLDVSYSEHPGFPVVCQTERPGIKLCRPGRIARSGDLSPVE